MKIKRILFACLFCIAPAIGTVLVSCNIGNDATHAFDGLGTLDQTDATGGVFQ